jgi:hypothetical protein
MRLDQLIQGNDVMQRHVATERGKQALTAVSPMARRAIQQEIIPQIEESVISVETAEGLCESTKRSIEAAFSYKNEIYTRLISYKSIDQSDQQYLEDCLIVMDEWLRATKATLQTDEEETVQETDSATKKTPDKQQVEVTVKVKPEVPKSEAPKTVGLEGIELRDTATGDVLPISFDDIFDLQDVRL